MMIISFAYHKLIKSTTSVNHSDYISFIQFDVSEYYNADVFRFSRDVNPDFPSAQCSNAWPHLK